MKFIASSKVSGAILVVLGFAVWFGASALIPESWDWWFVTTYLAGGLGFFVVGCFLPEYPDRRFLERKGALRLMAFFFWLSANALARVPMIQELSPSEGWVAIRLVPASLVLAFGSYLLAVFLIRGFRARPEYFADNDSSDAEQGDVPSHVAPALKSTSAAHASEES